MSKVTFLVNSDFKTTQLQKMYGDFLQRIFAEKHLIETFQLFSFKTHQGEIDKYTKNLSHEDL